MKKRRRFKQTTTLEDRLRARAAHLQEEARKMEPGPARDALLRLAHLSLEAAGMSEWLRPLGVVTDPGMQDVRSAALQKVESDIVAAQIKEESMAVNKPTGDNARKGAVKKRSQVKTTIGGASGWTKRDKSSGEFTGVKKPKRGTKAAKKFKGVRVEKKAAKKKKASKRGGQ
jgi:hypothetical protein